MTDKKDDKKRRVVRGPQDSIRENVPEQPPLPSYSDIVSGSTSDVLKDLTEDTGISATPLDQYPKLKRSQDGKVTIEGSVQAPTKKPQVAQSPAPTHQEARRTEIDGMLKKYADATGEQSRRQRQIGHAATSIAFSNPAAAKVYADGYDGYVNEPTRSIDGGHKAGMDSQKVTKGVSDQASTDQDRDPNSNVTRLAKQQLKKEFGIDAPEGSTAADIKKVFPMIKVDTQRDTSQRGQDLTYDTNTENRKSRQSEGRKNRFSREQIGRGHDQAAMGRTIVSGVLAQDKAAAQGTSGGVQTTANAATIPHAYAPGKYLVTRKGIPPNPHRSQQVTDLGGESVKYQQALQRAIDLVRQADGDPTILNKKWPQIQSAFAQATQRNIKAMGNGVANGPDIEQAVRIIGDPADLLTWLRSGLEEKMQQAVDSIPSAYLKYAESQGYDVSDTPSDITQSMGTGGANSTKKPVNPGLGDAANQAAAKFGYPAVTGPSPTPETPPIPAPDMNKEGTVTFITKDGKRKKISRADGLMLQQAGDGRIE